MNHWNDLTAIYTQHRGYIVNFFKGKRLRHEDAEDLAQQTFLLAARSWPEEMTQEPRPWLHKIAINVWRNHVRNAKAAKRDMHLVALSESPEAPAGTASAAAQLQTQEWVRHMLACLDKIPPILLQVLYLRGPGDCSVSEVAAMLRLEEGTVKSRTHAARKSLKSCLDKGERGPAQDASLATWEGYLREALTTLARRQQSAETGHLEEVTVVALVLDQLDQAAYENAIAHAVFCPKCLALWRALLAIDREGRTALSNTHSRPKPVLLGLMGLAAGLLFGILGSSWLLREDSAFQNPVRLELDNLTTPRGRATVELAPGKDAFDLQLHLPDARSYPRYLLELRQKDMIVRAYEGLQPDHGTLSVILATKDLPRGLVLVRVYGIEGDQVDMLHEHELYVFDRH